MLIILYFAVLMTFNILEELNITKPYFFITPSFTLLVGPILYYASQNLVSSRSLSSQRVALHCLPAIVSLPFTQYVDFIIALGSLSQIIYLFHSYKLLRRYENAALNSHSDELSIRLRWVENSGIIIVVFLLIDMIRLNSKHFISNEIYYQWYVFDLVLLLVICSYLLVKSLNQTELFTGFTIENDANDELNSENNNDITTNEDNALAQTLFDSINSKVLNLQLFKISKLTVQKVAEQTGLNVKDTSWAINVATGKNFNDYINGLRVNAVKAQLIANTDKRGAILDEALECGFNSKSAFNHAFKKFENMTPTQFLNSNFERS
ncbi:helix-turn-helix domain-containing protein [Alteromonas facilis]|uniref:helix-turn-helix domain-containing protein n=1 Tax=Alteromonas facilis TaxID=2048004 RepID=UPI0013DC7D30|nr:helix-turn-helix domain-containing protein [Alteromonas facilis]